MFADGKACFGVRCWVSIIVLVLAWSGSVAKPETPTNVKLIAAMPPGVESVMVTRLPALKSDGSVLKNEFSASPSVFHGNDVKAVVANARERAIPLVFAGGGSDFEMPPDSGMTGNFNERTIYIVEQPLDALRERLETGIDVEGVVELTRVLGVRVFEGTNDEGTFFGRVHHSADESWFVAIPDPHTVVTAETREDIEHILSSLKAPKVALPPRWRVIAEGHDLESPVVILREYPPGKPGTPFTPEEADVKQFALTWTDVKTLVFKVSLAATDMEKAIHWYKPFGPLGRFSWDVHPTSAGLWATLSPGPDGVKPQSVPHVFLMLFGICVMI